MLNLSLSLFLQNELSFKTDIVMPRFKVLTDCGLSPLQPADKKACVNTLKKKQTHPTKTTL